MRTKLDDLIKTGKDIGTFKDGPLMRESIQRDAKTLSEVSKRVKDELYELKKDENYEVNEYEKEFNSLREQMQAQLPPIIAKLKQSAEEDNKVAPVQGSNQVLDQELIDRESEQIEVLEIEVRNILATMREVNQIFTQTLEELQKQQHMIATIDGHTEEAVNDMRHGNESLDKAKQHQKSSTKTLCWLLLFFMIIVAGIGLYIWSTSGSKPKPSPTPGPHNSTISGLVGLGI